MCPHSIFVTKSGNWKLGGLEFIEKIGDVDNGEIPCQAWTTRMPKYAQVDLNYTAPEIQHKSVCSSASDMFSFGLLMVSVFNGGQSLIQANYSTNLYFKQAGVVRRYFCITALDYKLLFCILDLGTSQKCTTSNPCGPPRGRDSPGFSRYQTEAEHTVAFTYSIFQVGRKWKVHLSKKQSVW